jgi:hypothetical protein
LAHYLLPGKGLLVFALLAAALSVGFGLTGKETLRRAVLCCFGAALGFSWYAVALHQIAPLEAVPWEERTITACVKEYTMPQGYELVPGWFSWAETIMFGKQVGATPNGRLAGQPISDTMSASQQADTNGPLAAARSYGKLDYTKYSNGTLLNMWISQSEMMEV